MSSVEYSHIKTTSNKRIGVESFAKGGGSH